MRSAIAHERLVWWPRIPSSEWRSFVPASDPAVPSGLPVVVDVVAKHVGRDSVQRPDTFHPVRVGTIAAWSGWVRHDPACTAAAHAALRAYVNRRQALAWTALVNVEPGAATAAWVYLAGRFTENLATNLSSRIAVSVNQAGTASPPCTWWVAGDVGRLIG